MHSRSLLLWGCLALGCASPAAAEAWVAPDADAHVPNPVADGANARAVGKDLYEQYCTTCHGPTGKGDGPGGEQLTPKPGDLSDPKLWDESDGALYWKIVTGRTAMPSFKYFLTDTQRWQVVRYLRSFAPRPTPAPAAPGAAAPVPPKPPTTPDHH